MQAVEATFGGVALKERAFAEWAIVVPFDKGNLGGICASLRFPVVGALLCPIVGFDSSLF